jgi:8-oxo-dGTP diphosphatase
MATLPISYRQLDDIVGTLSRQGGDKYMTFAVTVDLVMLTIRESALCVLLVRRAIPPFPGAPALPGGFVLPEEDLDEGRDPRGRVVTVAYLALLPDAPAPRPGSDAAAAQWVPVAGAPPLAFDHDRILADGVERARAKLEYSPLAAAFCPPEFTIAELRQVYEAVWSAPLDPRNFHRKVTSTPGFVIPTGRSTAGERGRPAQLFTRGPATLLHPPLLRAAGT